MNETLTVLQDEGQTWAIRWDRDRPMTAYLLLDNWYRRGVLPSKWFGFLIAQVCQEAGEEV